MSKILLFDLETAPMSGYFFRLFDVNIGFNQVKKHSFILSFAAKWLGSSKVIYHDLRDGMSEKKQVLLLNKLHELLSEADCVITQNGKSFDSKVANTHFAVNRMKPVKPYQHMDTKVLAKKHFHLPSYSLEYMAMLFCKKHHKLKHKNFSGFELWDQCLEGNPAAWNEMKEYNVHDVLTLEELFNVIAPFGTGVELNPMHAGKEYRCQNPSCQSTNLERRGFSFSKVGKFQRYQCKTCGSWHSSKVNLLSKEKKQSLKLSKP